MWVAIRAAILLQDFLSSIAMPWFYFRTAHDTSTHQIHHPKYQKITKYIIPYTKNTKQIMPNTKQTIPNTKYIIFSSPYPGSIRHLHPGGSTQILPHPTEKILDGRRPKIGVFRNTSNNKISGQLFQFRFLRWPIFARPFWKRNHWQQLRKGVTFILTGQQVWESSQEYWGSEQDFLLGGNSKALAAKKFRSWTQAVKLKNNVRYFAFYTYSSP